MADTDRPMPGALDLRGVPCPLAWAKAKVHLETLTRGVACPLAWAKTKVRLEDLARGTAVDVVIDDPRSLRDLPRAAEANGHHVVAVDTDGPPWRVRLEV